MKRILFAAGVMVLAGILLVMAGWAGETARRPKILGIAYVRVRVTDLGKAARFYSTILRLPTGEIRDGNWVQMSFVVNGNQRIELAKAAPGASGSYLEEIGFATDDLMKLRAYLTAKGAAADRIMTWPDGTPHFQTADPEGNKIVFVQEKWRADYFGGGDDAISRRLLHAGFVVKDWKAENRFYEDVLGFRLYWKGGFKDDGLDWYEIQVPDGDNWIEYMLNIPAKADHKELGVQNHFSLGVKSADDAAKILREHGLKDFDGPEVGRDGKNSLDAYDPDGTRVELMEFTPVEKACCAEYTGAHPKP